MTPDNTQYEFLNDYEFVNNQTWIGDDDLSVLNETEIICVCDDVEPSFWADFDLFDGDVLAVFLGIVTTLGTVIGYFIQRNKERKAVKEEEQERLENIDRQQALDRVRMQMRVYVGPFHRLIKIQMATMMQYMRSNHIKFQRNQHMWATMFSPVAIEPYLDDPHSLEARHYRSFVEYRMKPIYTKARSLHLNYSSNLADMPTQDEYLSRWGEDVCKSPYVGSVNINVIFDTYVAWTHEFDDIIEAWKEGDYTRMQPETKVAWVVANYIVDYLRDNAKKKEAEYNKHVKVHINEKQVNFSPIEFADSFDQATRESIVESSNTLRKRSSTNTTNPTYKN